MPYRSPDFRITPKATPKLKPVYHSLYHTTAWRKYRKDYLSHPDHLWCACGCGRVAEVVDHITPHRGDEALFWSADNHQGLAAKCHNAKSAKERLD